MRRHQGMNLTSRRRAHGIEAGLKIPPPPRSSSSSALASISVRPRSLSDSRGPPPPSASCCPPPLPGIVVGVNLGIGRAMQRPRPHRRGSRRGPHPVTKGPLHRHPRHPSTRPSAPHRRPHRRLLDEGRRRQPRRTRACRTDSWRSLASRRDRPSSRIAGVNPRLS